MTGDTTPPAVRALAERLWKDYDSQYSSSHLTWVDFEPEARGHLQALADAGLLCSSPVVQPKDEEGSLRSEPPASDGRSAVYVTVSREQVHRTSCHSDNTVNVDLDGNGVPVGVEVIGAIGLEVDGHPVNLPGSGADTEKLVAAVAEGLRDFKFEVGPNTLEMLKVGQAVYLTPEERHRLAHAAVNAHGQVMRDE